MRESSSPVTARANALRNTWCVSFTVPGARPALISARGREADDVRLVSQLGWLFWSGNITERQFEAGEIWRREATRNLYVKYDVRPFPKASKFEKHIPGQNSKEHAPSKGFEQAHRMLGVYVKDLDNLCVYDQYPVRGELARIKKGLDMLASNLRLDARHRGEQNCL